MLVAFIGLATLNYVVGGRDVLYPGFVFCSIWAAATAMYLLCPVQVDELEWKTALIFVAGALFFTAGCIIGKRSVATSSTSFKAPASSHLGVQLLLIYSVVMLPFIVIDTMRIVGQSVLSPEFLMASKEAFQNADTSISGSKIIAIAPLIAVPTVWLLLLENERRALIIIGCCSATFMCLLGGTRGTLFHMICGCFVVVLMRRSSRAIRDAGMRVAAGVLGVVVVMTLLSLVIKHETQGSDGLQIAVDMSATYVAGPLAAFNYQVTHPALFSDQPMNTITPALSPLIKSGLIQVALPPVHEEFIDIPFPFNVFTIYKPYYHDFGALGCVLVLALLGFIYGHVFWGAVRGNKLAIFFLAALMEPLVMSVFHDPFNYRLTLHMFTVLFALTYFCVLRKLPRLTSRSAATLSA